MHIILISTILIIFSSSFNLVSAQIVNEKPIRLAVIVFTPYLLAYLAEEKGYFEKNNVAVNLTLIQNYGDAIRDYSNGDYDGMMLVYPDSLIQNAEGINTKVVYNLDTTTKGDAIVGNGNNLSDVKGKKIGVEEINGYSHLFVLKSLEKVGLDEGDVEFVTIPVQNISDALKEGKIFAGHTYIPFISDSVKNGYKILSTALEIPGVITDVVSFHSDIVEQRPQDIQNIIKSLIEAKEDYDKNKEQDIEIMSSKSGLSKELIINGMEGAKLLDLNFNAQVSMNNESNEITSLYNSGNNLSKFFAERGVISEYPNLEDILEPKFVNELFIEKSHLTESSSGLVMKNLLK
jgi:NitT/TauT family transport system substrate-binding protein